MMNFSCTFWHILKTAATLVVKRETDTKALHAFRTPRIRSNGKRFLYVF